ncbi:MAG: hypothetical protein LBI64_01655, partial [Coriobacteriales bacterium]|nr:hypothetical protein [Coriobacteriales bacterium]
MSATKTLTPRRILTAFLSFVLASFLCVGIIPPQGIQQAYAAGAVGYVVGTTPISEGMAAGADDITVYNDQIAFSLAVSSNNYWSMTKGSILDIARIEDGVYGKDLVNDVEFLNDLWTATGTYDGQNL